MDAERGDSGAGKAVIRAAAFGGLDGRAALGELAGSYWYCVDARWRWAGLDAGRAATNGFDLLDGKMMPTRTEGVAANPLCIETGWRYTMRVEVPHDGCSATNEPSASAAIEARSFSMGLTCAKFPAQAARKVTSLLICSIRE